jgi:hypothetical protein
MSDRAEKTWPTYSELVAALHDFAQLLPPDRWRLLHPETNDALGRIQMNENAEREVVEER